MKNIRRVFTPIAFMLFCTPAFSIVTVDQQHDELIYANTAVPIYTNPNNWMGDTLSYAIQTFTVGLDGTFAGIDIFGPANYMGNTGGSLTVKLYGGLSSPFYSLNGISYGEANYIGSVDVQSSSLPNSSSNGLFVDLSSIGYFTSAGEYMAFEVYAQDQQYTMLGSSCQYISSGNCQNYTGGISLRSNGSIEGASYMFRTYVEVPAPIPEPETYALMLAGLALVGAAARRSNRLVSDDH
jgi:PEP-CTERM motif